MDIKKLLDNEVAATRAELANKMRSVARKQRDTLSQWLLRWTSSEARLRSILISRFKSPRTQ
jgi:hypothetical protein